MTNGKVRDSFGAIFINAYYAWDSRTILFKSADTPNPYAVRNIGHITMDYPRLTPGASPSSTARPGRLCASGLNL